jgi:acetyl/propionyl-CoA carboxylase alpha subunit
MKRLLVANRGTTAAVDLAQSVGYRSAGKVEFLVAGRVS